MIRAPAAGGNELEDVMRLPFGLGDLSPQTLLELDTDEGLTFTHRVAVLDEPFDDLSRPRRGHRPLSVPRHDGTQLCGQGHSRGIRTALRRAEHAGGRRHD